MVGVVDVFGNDGCGGHKCNNLRFSADCGGGVCYFVQEVDAVGTRGEHITGEW